LRLASQPAFYGALTKQRASSGGPTNAALAGQAREGFFPMTDMAGFAHRQTGASDDRIDDRATDGAVDEMTVALGGGDERRMHVRAYNYWVSLLKGRPYPPIDELDPASIADFGPHSVLIDFSGGVDDPGIAFLGHALREECDVSSDIRRIADVPARSLLSRLTDHYLQIIANRAPIGFEAEFVGTRGRTTMYRGILMPFSSDGEAIDYIYGVINWKEMVDAATQAGLTAELDAAVRTAPVTAAAAPVWADGPSAGAAPSDGLTPEEAADAGEALLSGSLADRLVLARESAAQVRASDQRGRAALYRALGRAHDFAQASLEDPAAYLELLADAGIAVQARAPLTPVAKLVFGADHDRTRLAEYAAVLAHARRHGVATGGLQPFLDAADGGVKGVVAAERAARRPAPAPDLYERIRAELHARPALAPVDLPAAGDDFVVLLARPNEAGALDVVARIETPAVVASLVRRAA
jgi:hypothetical protein